MQVDLGHLGFDEGGYLLVKRALRHVAVGEEVEVTGLAAAPEIHLTAWARAEGHQLRWAGTGADRGPALLRRGGAEPARWTNAERAGLADPLAAGGVVEAPPLRWGLAARGATVEAGAPDFSFTLTSKAEVWADDAVHLYAQAVAAQWDPNTAVDWNAPGDLPDEVEDAVVQVMTYLIENEMAALVDEPDFAIASFLLSVLGEGTFLTLLWFLERHAPDTITRTITRLAAQDEARHVFDALVLLAAGAWDHDALRRGSALVGALLQDMDRARQGHLKRLGYDAAEAAELSALHTRNFM
jgi:hypothetical protein